MSNPKWFKYEWIWDKKISGNPLLAKISPLKTHENVLIFSKRKHNYYPVMRKGALKIKGGGFSKILNMPMAKTTNDDYYPVSIINSSNANRGIHPTQKPVALIEYLIKTYTQEGELILDNTAGSGTLAIAAINTNRQYICIEKDPHYLR
jgi:site-specific DNA-methyltransferase (adenine-specific)